jgi:hypothetical protein
VASRQANVMRGLFLRLHVHSDALLSAPKVDLRRYFVWSPVWAVDQILDEKDALSPTLMPLLWWSECVGSMQWRQACIFSWLTDVVLYLPADHGPISMSCTVLLSPKLNLSEAACTDLGICWESCDGRDSLRLRACCGYCLRLPWYYSFRRNARTKGWLRIGGLLQLTVAAFWYTGIYFFDIVDGDSHPVTGPLL